MIIIICIMMILMIKKVYIPSTEILFSSRILIKGLSHSNNTNKLIPLLLILAVLPTLLT